MGIEQHLNRTFTPLEPFRRDDPEPPKPYIDPDFDPFAPFKPLTPLRPINPPEEEPERYAPWEIICDY